MTCVRKGCNNPAPEFRLWAERWAICDACMPFDKDAADALEAELERLLR